MCKPLPLLKLPYLVQKIIFKTFNYEEIFNLSLCSEKASKLVQRIPRKPQKVRYHFDDNKIEVVIGENEFDKEVVHMASMKRVTTIPDLEVNTFKIGNEKFEFRSVETKLPEECFHTIEYIESRTVLPSLQKHIDSLWPNSSPRVQLQIESIDGITRSTELRNVKDTVIKTEEIDSSQIEEILTIHPNQDSVYICSSLIGQSFSPESKLMKVNGLFIQKSDQFSTREIYKNFDGCFLILRRAKFDISIWDELVERWRRKEAYRNLKAFTAIEKFALVARHEHPEWEELYRNLNEMGMFEVRETKTIILEERIVNFQRYNRGQINLTGYREMQQVEDGKKATIHVDPYYISFVTYEN